MRSGKIYLVFGFMKSMIRLWRSIAKMKNSANTNLLVLDEVFDSSLDSTGTEEFLKLIQTVGQDTNVFVISHKGDALYEKFENNNQLNKNNEISTNFYNELIGIQKKYIERQKHDQEQNDAELKKYSLEFDIDDEPSEEMKKQMKEIEEEMKKSGEKPVNIVKREL